VLLTQSNTQLRNSAPFNDQPTPCADKMQEGSAAVWQQHSRQPIMISRNFTHCMPCCKIWAASSPSQGVLAAWWQPTAQGGTQVSPTDWTDLGWAAL